MPLQTLLLVTSIIHVVLFGLLHLDIVIWKVASLIHIIPSRLAGTIPSGVGLFIYHSVLFILLALLLILIKTLMVFLQSWNEAKFEPLTEMQGLRWISVLAAVLIPIFAIFAIMKDGISHRMMTIAFISWIGLSGGSLWKLLPLEDEDILPLPPEPTEEEEEPEGDLYNKNYNWKFKEKPHLVAAQERSFAMELKIDKQRYEDFRNRDHGGDYSNPDSYARFVTENLDDEVVRASKKIRTISETEKFDEYLEASNILAFALSFEYQYDHEVYGDREYPKYSIETLVDEKGDCEDHAILAAALMKTLGHDVVLLDISYPGTRTGHMALALSGADHLSGTYIRYSGKKYFYCEATPGRGTTKTSSQYQWYIGECPSSEIEKIVPVRI